jgi:hypothetical protein
MVSCDVLLLVAVQLTVDPVVTAAVCADAPLDPTDTAVGLMATLVVLPVWPASVTVRVTVCPPPVTAIVGVTGEPPVLAATLYVIVPLPVPELPPVRVSCDELLLTAIQLTVDAAVTVVVCAVAPLDPIDMAVGLMARLVVLPVW